MPESICYPALLRASSWEPGEIIPLHLLPQPRGLRCAADHLPALALCILTAIAYGNSFGRGFPFDNAALILPDARLHAATSENVSLILDHTYWWPYQQSGLYRPVTSLSYLFNYAVLGIARTRSGTIAST